MLYAEYRSMLARQQQRRPTSEKKRELKRKFAELASRFQNAMQQHPKAAIPEEAAEEHTSIQSLAEAVQVLQDSDVSLYLNEAATLIQKTWRGYYTRKVLAMYMEMV